MSMEKYNEVVNTEVLDTIHKAIRILKTSCSLPPEKSDDKDMIIAREENKKRYNEIFFQEGEQLKKAINQFIDLQLVAYGNFTINDENMYWCNENDNAVTVKVKSIPVVNTYEQKFGN